MCLYLTVLFIKKKREEEEEEEEENSIIVFVQRRRRRKQQFFHSIFIPFLSQSGGESYQQTEGVIYAVLLVQESWHMPAVCVLHLRGVLFGLLPIMGQPLQEWRKHCQCVDELELELEWLKYQER